MNNTLLKIIISFTVVLFVACGSERKTKEEAISRLNDSTVFVYPNNTNFKQGDNFIVGLDSVSWQKHKDFFHDFYYFPEFFNYEPSLTLSNDNECDDLKKQVDVCKNQEKCECFKAVSTVDLNFSIFGSYQYMNCFFICYPYKSENSNTKKIHIEVLP